MSPWSAATTSASPTTRTNKELQRPRDETTPPTDPTDRPETRAGPARQAPGQTGGDPLPPAHVRPPHGRHRHGPRLRPAVHGPSGAEAGPGHGRRPAVRDEGHDRPAARTRVDTAMTPGRAR